MAVAKIDSDIGTTNWGEPQSATFDATGATLLWAVSALSSGASVTFSDSGGNDWTTLTVYSSDTTRIAIGYAYKKGAGALSVSNAQWVKATWDAGTYGMILAGAVSGTLTSADPLAGENGASDNGGATGTITPSQAGDWILSATASGSTLTSLACATGYTVFVQQADSGYFVGGAADLATANTSAIGATWTGINGNRPCVIACFKMDAGGGGGSTVPSFLLRTRQLGIDLR